ncbi:MAG TPA: CYTH domain-containing protein [Candidatus Limnocylindrales bacterium]|nr:CYTH domain-containing protein [Candidatus Limnocylindrales bacterium]
MQETEVKILEVDRKKVERTLTGLGAKKVFEGDIQTLLFDFKDGRIVKARDVLRLRKEQDKSEITYKKVHETQTVKRAQEYTVEVSNMEMMRKILENLGLTITESMQKHRVSYVLDHARFDIDCYFGSYGFIPEFMEIEAENLGLIHKYAELLGFKAEDCLPWSTYELVQHYSSQKKNEQTKTLEPK